MRRLLNVTLAATVFAGLFLALAPAEAGPVARLRERVIQRLAPHSPQANPPACPGGVCPVPVAAQRPAPVPAPKVMQQPAPKVVEGLGDGRLRDRLLLAVVRARAVDHAIKHGVPVAGGGTRKVTREEAQKLADKVSDEAILRAAKVYGAPVGEGRLAALFDWLVAHKEQILELVKFVLSLFALFADDEPPTP